MKVVKAASAVLVVCAVLALGACQQRSSASSIQSAKDHLAKREYPASVIELKNALQVSDSAEARFLLGKALAESAQPDLALIELEKALALGYSRDQVYPVMGSALIAQRKFGEVISRYEAVRLGDRPADAELRVVVSSAFVQTGNVPKAQQQLALALEVDPTALSAQLLNVRYMAGQGQIDEALVRVDKILSAHPTDAVTLTLKGDLLQFGKADHVKAIDAYRAALTSRRDMLPAFYGLMDLLVLQRNFKAAEEALAAYRKTAPKSLDVRYYEGLIAFHGGDFKRADQIARELIGVVPDNVRVLQLSGAIALQAGYFAQAETLVGKAMQLTTANESATKLLAVIYLRWGDANKAIRLLKPYVDRNPKDAEALSQIARAYLSIGETQESTRYFKQALDLKPNDGDSRAALAVMQLRAGSVESGLNDLRSIASSDAGTTADLALISALVEQKNVPAALEAVTRLEKKTPDNPIVPLIQGRLELDRRDVSAARRSFERALKVSPVYFPAVSALASLDLSEKKPEAARQRFEALLKQDARNVQAQLALAQMRMAAGASKDELVGLLQAAIRSNPAEERPRQLLVDLLLRSKDIKAAMAAAQEASAALPESPRMIDGLGRVQMAAGEFQQAIASLNKAVLLEPRSEQGQLRLAEAFMASGQTSAAETSLRRALALAPQSISTKRALVSMKMAVGANAEAIAMSREIQTQDPIGYLLEGEIHSKQRNWEAAITAYRAGLRRHESTGLAVKLHGALSSAGRREEAATFGNGWITRFPKDDIFIFYMADGALVRRDYAAAEKYYLRFIELKPDSPIALNNLASITSTLRKPGALQYAERASQLLPNHPAILDTLATLLADGGQAEKALSVQKRAVSLASDVPSLRLNLAKLLIKQGDKAGARTELESLGRRQGNYPERAEVEQLLGTL